MPFYIFPPRLQLILYKHYRVVFLSTGIQSVYHSTNIQTVYHSTNIQTVYHSTNIQTVYHSTNIDTVYHSTNIQTVYHSTNILALNLELEANHPDWEFPWFSCPSRQILERNTLKQDTTASLDVSSINNPN